jgi:hypothetical protein
VNDQFIRATIDIIATLTQGSPSITDTVSVIITGRFVGIKTMLNEPPASALRVVRQSGKKKATSKRQPFDEAQVYDKLVKPVAEKAMMSLSEMAEDALPYLGELLLGILDRPESVEETKAVVIDGSGDYNGCAKPIPAPALALYQNSYLQHKPDMIGIGMKDWSILDYARIPGIAGIVDLTNAGGATNNIQLNGPIPCTYVTGMFEYSRGGRDVLLQFFCSSFTSGRFALKLQSQTPVPGTNDWQNEMTKIIDVKGDTDEPMCVPFVFDTPWAHHATTPMRLQLERLSDIISNDTAVDPKITLVVWMAAARDFQVSCPRAQTWAPSYIGALPAPLSLLDTPRGKKLVDLKLIKRQTSVQEMFSKSFPAFPEGSAYAQDSHFCMSEETLLWTDIMKRFYRFAGALSGVPDPYGSFENEATVLYPGAAFRAFLMHRGGIIVKTHWSSVMPANTAYVTGRDDPGVTNEALGVAFPDSRGVSTMALPHYSTYPFYLRSNANDHDMIGLNWTTTAGQVNNWLAARDDWLLGFPVLPQADVASVSNKTATV